MTFKRFEPKDVIYNTLVAKPEVNFIVHSGTVYYQKENIRSGSYGNYVKHIEPGDLSLYELNIDRPSGSLIYSYLHKDSTRYSHKTISTSRFDDETVFSFGDILKQEYPMSASINRIYIPTGSAFSSSSGLAHANKKYILSLENPINSQGSFRNNLKYGSLSHQEVNMICVPGIFYGSSVDKGSVDLRYHLNGNLLAQAKDINSNGRLIETYGPSSGSQVGIVLYRQGLILLTSSVALHDTHQEYYLSTSSLSSPSWVNFATGLETIGQGISYTPTTSSAYTINLKGVNKIPNLTMYAYAKEGEFNYSKNPTFLQKKENYGFSFTGSIYSESKKPIKKVNKSLFKNYEEEFENTVYISKIGIYDKDKNLIAIASLANPVKKTEAREFMFKLKMDF